MFDKYSVKFLTPMLYSDAPNGIDFELEKSAEVSFTIGNELYTVIIPRGFITDFASVPFIFRGFIPKAYGRYRKAAVLHDYLCRYHSIQRDEADRVFYAAMRECGVPKWKRISMYFAVSIYTQLLKIKNFLTGGKKNG